MDGSLNTSDHQASAGSAIMVYLTGQGAVSPPVPTRQAAPASPLSYVTATATATIDGVSAKVLFAGLAPGFVGLGQVNVAIPGGLSPGQHKVVIDIGGVKTNEVTFDSN
jgi:adhesin/invasin